MLKAVLFDMDGVIIDSESVHFKLEDKMYKDLGIEVTKEEHNSFVGTTSHYMWEILRAKYNLTHSLEELVSLDRDIFFKHLNSKESEIVLVEGVKDFIKDLYNNGIRMAVASSSPLDVIQAIVKTFGLEKYFEVLVTGDYVKRSKPEPDIFLFAAEKLGVKIDECFVVEDSHNGVLAAKKAGMKCIGFKNLNSGNQDISMADIVIDNFADIRAEELIMN